MSDFCFGNNSWMLGCPQCYLRTGIKKDIPDIAISNDELIIKFGERVVAKDFSSYFGSIQKLFIDSVCASIVIDISNTLYMNQICISKILLTVLRAKNLRNIRVVMKLPEYTQKNKMLRYFKNLGVLDTILNLDGIELYIDDIKVDDFEQHYVFPNFYDEAIFPFTIFSFIKETNDYVNNIENSIQKILVSTKAYYIKMNKNSVFEKIRERLYIYLYELIENIFEHAYRRGEHVFFTIAISNNYLPPYMRTKNNSKKFGN